MYLKKKESDERNANDGSFSLFQEERRTKEVWKKLRGSQRMRDVLHDQILREEKTNFASYFLESSQFWKHLKIREEK